MQVLTISEPYATLIADGQKWCENRTWRTNHQGPLVIHAGKASRYLKRADLARYPHRGCAIAIVEVVGCWSSRDILDNAERRPDAIAHLTPWTWRQVAEHEHMEGPYCWMLTNVRKLPQPVPLIGKQGLFDVDPALLGLHRDGSFA